VDLSASPIRPSPLQGAIVVCGLGSLGQACLLRLLDFEVALIGLDLNPPAWSHPELAEALAGQVRQGDMRRPEVLRGAAVVEARSVLLLSSESTVNFEAALQVRLLNPRAEIVVRSSSRDASFGALLEQRLPGIAVVDPLLLTAAAVAQSLRSGDQAAHFEVDGHRFEVFDAIDPAEIAAATSYDRNYRSLRLPKETGWGTRPRGSMVVSPLGFRRSLSSSPTRHPAGESAAAGGHGQSVRARFLQLMRPWQRAWDWVRQRTALQWVTTGLLLTLLAGGIGVFSLRGGWQQGLFVTLALLKGEYVDPVNVLLAETPRQTLADVDGRLIAGTLLYSLIGTLLTSGLVAVILERLLSARFGIARPRTLKRGSSQVLLLHGGAMAAQVGAVLMRARLQVVRVEASGNGGGRSGGPEGVVVERLENAETLLRHCRVEAIGLLSTDLLANLQGALSLQQRWPQARLVILSHAVEAAERLGELLGGVTVLSTMDLACDALVATAFGERVAGIARIQGSNLLLVRYLVKIGDSLCGRSIARLESGYGVTVITRRQPGTAGAKALPPPETTLAEGDQLVILADLAGLRRIELGRLDPPGWRLQLEAHLPTEALFEVKQCLGRYFGKPPGALAHLLDGGIHFTDPLDEDFGHLVERKLTRLGVRCAMQRLETMD
jgi:Trk K+ transport system NAD-binding subunit